MTELVVTAVIVGALLLAAKLSEEITERLGFPGFLGAILAGFALGGGGLGLIDRASVESAEILFVIGINFTLFLAGVEELSNPAILVPSRSELAYGLLYLGLPTLTALAVLYYLTGLSVQPAIALALVLAIASAGPLVKILLSRGELGGKELSMLKMALVSELTGLTLFNTFAQGFNVMRLVESAFFVFFVVYIGRRYLDELMFAVERYIAVREAPFAIVVAIVLTASYLAEILGFNSAVTALMFGAFLSEYLLQRPLCLERIRALTYGFLEPLFFVGIGLQSAPLQTSTLALMTLLIAAVSTPKLAVALAKGIGGKEAIILLAKGGVDAALLSTMLQRGLIDKNLYTASLMTIIISAIAASASVRIKERVPEPVRLKLRDLPLDKDIIREDSYADYAAEVVSKRGAAVVVNERLQPIGYITAEDFVGISSELLSRLPVKLLLRMEVPIVYGDMTVAELLSNPSLIHEPIIAVINEKGEVIGTLSPRKLLSLLLHTREGKGAQERRPHNIPPRRGEGGGSARR